MGRKPAKPVESILKEHNDVTLKAFMVNDLHLSGNELIIFAVVYSFSQDGESCFYGSRKYLASWCQIHEGAVDYQLNKLLKKGLITKSHTRREDGSLCSILRANLPLIESLMGQSQKFESGDTKICDSHTQKFSTGYTQKFMTNKEEVNTQVDTKEDKERIPFSEIIDYLNEKANRRYRPSTPKTREHIRARWNEGYRLDDFKRVIDVKVADWFGDDKMDRYLCPDTLFGTKFEKYLNQPMPKNVTQQKRGATQGHEPRIGSMRIDNMTGRQEVYKGNGVWEEYVSDYVPQEGDEDIDL